MDNKHNPTLSIVAPVYNEEENVHELVDRIVESCRELSEPFEIVIVNDGSADKTLDYLVALSRTIPELRVVDLLRNFGHMPALSAGLTHARGDGVIIMDGDLQDPPELIPQFYKKWLEGNDVVYGLRTERGEEGPKRAAISGFYWLLTKLSDTKIPKQVGTYCLIDRRIVDILCSMPERDRYFAGLRAWVGGKQAFVSYKRPDRPDGRSRVGLRGLFHLARAGLLSFSKAPLRIASIFAMIIGFVMLIVGAQAVIKRLFTNLAIPGWASTLTMLGALGFSQSLIMAVISEYLAVVFSEIKARPLYLVRNEYVGGERVK